MRTILFLFLPIILFSFAPAKEERLTKVKVYMVKWNSRYTVIRTIENIPKTYLYYFETSDSDLIDMFSDYDDCVKKISNQDTIAQSFNPAVSIYTVLYFGNKKVEIFFKNTGEYYYNGIWHKMNSGLYYHLFSYFSNEIVPIETLNKAKSNTTDSFWHDNL